MLPTGEERLGAAAVPRRRDACQLRDGEVEALGGITFDTRQVQTLRLDIFQPGHFLMFDALVQAAKHSDLQLEYHFEEAMHSHVIDAINGHTAWRYRARCSGGWTEANVIRRDMYPYKNGAQLRVHKENDARLDAILESFRQEADRLTSHGGRVIIPDITIRSPDWTRVFQYVIVTAHDVRSDLLQPGVVTDLDALLGLGEQEALSRLKLTWHGRIGSADPVET